MVKSLSLNSSICQTLLTPIQLSSLIMKLRYGSDKPVLHSTPQMSIANISKLIYAKPYFVTKLLKSFPSSPTFKKS